MTQHSPDDEELARLDKAIACDPSSVDAFIDRGTILHKVRRFREAVESFDEAIAITPDNAGAFHKRGHALRDMNRLDEALASYDRAIALRPNFAHAWTDRGTVLLLLMRLQEAKASFDRAIALKPDFAEAYNNRGTALHYLKRLDEAVASFNQAIEIRNGFANAIFNRGVSRLLDGNFREGWADYEWRWKTKAFRTIPDAFNAKCWRGEKLAGRSIVVHAREQGLGDVIQFARYLPLLVGRHAKVTFVCPANLVRLLRSLLSGVEVVTSPGVEQSFDFHCPLMSLPFGFGTDISSIPNAVPYLAAEKGLANRWKEQLGDHGFKIGIGWHIGASHDWSRSIPLAEFVPLANLPNVRLISLQKNYGLDQLAGLPVGTRVEMLGNDFDNGPDAFVDTAAVMEGLDLIITADTSIAHVAGALGRPTWVGLKNVPDWRWLLDRGDSPWYPSARLFRQKTDGDWKFVFSEIEQELRSLCAR